MPRKQPDFLSSFSVIFADFLVEVQIALWEKANEKLRAPDPPNVNDFS